jgi:hypothetical protein
MDPESKKEANPEANESKTRSTTGAQTPKTKYAFLTPLRLDHPIFKAGALICKPLFPRRDGDCDPEAVSSSRMTPPVAP